MEELEVLIALRGDVPDAEAAVSRRLREITVLVLGNERRGVPEILEFQADDETGRHTYVPVFTRTEFVSVAAERQSAWRSLALLEVRGEHLLDTLHGLTLVVNPWSVLEMKLPLP